MTGRPAIGQAPPSSRHSPPLPELALFFVAYLAGAGFAQWLAIVPGTGISIWPPSGVLVGTLLVRPARSWPWFVLAAALAELSANALWFRNPLAVAALMVAGNAAGAVLAAWSIGRVRAPPFRLATVRDVLLLVLGAGLAPLASATVGAATLAAFGLQRFASAWPLWWVGDATGVLIVAPLVLVLVEEWRDWREAPWRRWLELCALVSAFLVVGWLSLAGYLPFAYLVMPILLWASVRFEFKGAAVLLILLAVTTATFTVWGVSQFVGEPQSQRQKYVMMQLFLAISAVSALIVAALARQGRRALARLESANLELERRVAERTARLRENERRLSTVLGALPIGVALVDREGAAVVANEVFRRYAPTHVPSHDAARHALWQGRDESGRPVDRRDFPAARALRGESVWPGTEFLFLGDAARGPVWTRVAALPMRDDRGAVVGAVAVIEDVDAEKRARDALAASERQTKVLLREVNHRSKNLLSLVQAIARRTAAAGDPTDFLARFEARLRALAASQDLLVRSGWRGIGLRELVRSVLMPLGEEGGARVSLEGPQLVVGAAAAQALAMALHELATNAVKYGALSSATGEVALTWTVEAERFAMAWVERGGPPVAGPSRRGFGSSVLGRVTRQALDADVGLVFAPEGLRWTLSCALRNVLDEEGGPVEARSPRVRPPDAHRTCVLVVEDEALLAQEVAQDLEEAGYAVLGPAADVAQAMDILDAGRCDCAVLDVTLGRETSEPVAARLAAAGIPFVVLTGYGRHQLPPALADAPLVAKPLDRAALLAEVARCVRAEGPARKRVDA